MDISPAHEAAVIAACRVPALNARLALLASGGATRASIALYADPAPITPGDPPGAAPIVSMNMTAASGIVDDTNFQILLDTPIEAQVDGADVANGSVPTWARVNMPDGSWWADLTVTVEGAGGEIQLVQTGTDGGGQPEARLFNGAFARIASAVIQG